MTSMPTVGRVVHYVSAGSADGRYPSVCRAADVTEVDGEQLGLMVKNPTGIHFRPIEADGGPKYDENKAPGTWHWPERA